MSNKSYQLKLSVDGYKSYYDGAVTLTFSKPITVLAGPNGEGKSNLLEGLLIPTAHFLRKTVKFRDTALFHREVHLSSDPPVTASYYNLLFYDHVLRSLYKAKSQIGPPRRLHPAAVVSEGKSSAKLQFEVWRQKDAYEKLIAQFTVSYYRGKMSDRGVTVNELTDCDLLYCTADAMLTDYLVHLFLNEVEYRASYYPGTAQRANFVHSVLNYFPDQKQRLIEDVSEEGFLERFLGDTNRFLRENLATGAKKEVLVYLIGLILSRFRPGHDNLLVVLLDEVESGLNVMRQRVMMQALLHILDRFPEMRAQVKMLITTHSPVVFSELGARQDLVDVFYVLRDEKGPSRVYGEGLAGERPEKSQDVEKKILLELGLNVFELPQRVMFVEGDTERWFFQNVFDDCHIVPLDGGNLPRILRHLLGRLRLAWQKRYLVVVDSNRLESIRADVERMRKKYAETVRIDVETHEYQSFEEFLVDCDLSSAVNAATAWTRLETRFDEVDQQLRELGEAELEYDVSGIRGQMEQQGRSKEAVGDFLRSLKRNEVFYRTYGMHWRQVLSVSAREWIRKLQRRYQFSYKSE